MHKGKRNAIVKALTKAGWGDAVRTDWERDGDLIIIAEQDFGKGCAGEYYAFGGEYDEELFIDKRVKLWGSIEGGQSVIDFTRDRRYSIQITADYVEMQDFSIYDNLSVKTSPIGSLLAIKSNNVVLQGNIIGNPIESFKLDFDKPRIAQIGPIGQGLDWLTRGLFPQLRKRSKIVVDIDKCSLCGSCVEMCPFDAVKIENKSICINRDNCNLCLCCMESCSNQAMDFKGLLSHTDIFLR